MDQFERQTHMSNVVFDLKNLKVLKDSFNALFPIWEEVATARDNREIYETEGINEKLSELTTKYWESLKNIFIKDPYHGYEEGNFTDDDQIPAKLIMDLVDMSSQMNSSLSIDLKLRGCSDDELREEVRTLHAELTKTKRELADARWRAQDASTRLNTVRDDIDHLEGKNREKAALIAQLQRDGTVQLWEKEKTKILDKAGLRVKDLEKEVTTLKTDRGKLQAKLSNLESNLKMERIKTEVGKKPWSGDRLDLEIEVDNLKRGNFLLEKDVNKLDVELYTFQKVSVGIFQGLKDDYEKTFRPMLDGEKIEFSEDDVFRARMILQILRKVVNAAQIGKLGEVRADLPDNYIGIDSDIKECVVKRISIGYRSKLPPISENPSERVVTQKTSKRDVDARLAEKERLQRESAQAERRQSIRESHPVLIDPDSNRVNMIKVMQNFHHMTESFVKEHWEQFKKYDTNSDGTLDLSEMMHAMMSTVGSQFTAIQIQEAMLEVDVDSSDDIDFYEYLCVANMLQNKKGKSEVFKSKLVQQEGRMVSKTCIVM